MSASLMAIGLILSACDASKQQDAASKSAEKKLKTEQADVLPYLNIQEQAAKIALPFAKLKTVLTLKFKLYKPQMIG